MDYSQLTKCIDKHFNIDHHIYRSIDSVGHTISKYPRHVEITEKDSNVKFVIYKDSMYKFNDTFKKTRKIPDLSKLKVVNEYYFESKPMFVYTASRDIVGKLMEDRSKIEMFPNHYVVSAHNDPEVKAYVYVDSNEVFITSKHPIYDSNLKRVILCTKYEDSNIEDYLFYHDESLANELIDHINKGYEFDWSYYENVDKLIVGNIKAYVPNDIGDDGVDVLKFEIDGTTALLQLYSIINVAISGTCCPQFGSPIIFDKQLLLDHIEEFYEYINSTILGEMKYLPKEGIDTFADEYINYHFGKHTLNKLKR